MNIGQPLKTEYISFCIFPSASKLGIVCVKPCISEKDPKNKGSYSNKLTSYCLYTNQKSVCYFCMLGSTPSAKNPPFYNDFKNKPRMIQ